MSAASRTELARGLLPGLPGTATERIGQRTASFAEVFTVAGEDKLIDAITSGGPSAVRVVDTVIDAALARRTPSARARVLAWAGGVLTERQAEQALVILSQPGDPDDDPEIIWSGGLVRLRDPASSHLREHADLLSTSTRRALAAAVLQEAVRVAQDPDARAERYPGRDAAVNQWRLLLAFHAGQAGYPATAQQLLAPIIGGGTTEQRDAARAVPRALDGPRSDIRLQIILLEAELHATPATADEDRLRLHHALAWDYDQLGGYAQALGHAIEELSYRRRLQRRDHPDVLTNRYDIAYWTGEHGDAEGALHLSQELLPDRIRILGPDHPAVVTTRANITFWMAPPVVNAQHESEVDPDDPEPGSKISGSWVRLAPGVQDEGCRVVRAFSRSQAQSRR